MSLSPEHHQPVEINVVLAQAYAQTFIHRHDCYAFQRADGAYLTVKKPLTTNHLINHLQGKITLGAYALDAESHAHWLCLDADDEPAWEKLVELARILITKEITPYLETSRRGGHLWLFTPRLPGKTMRQFGKGLLQQQNITEKIELYPKQNQLTSGVGSLVRLPLGIHRKTGKRYPFIQVDGKPLAPTIREQIALLTQPQRVPSPFIDEMMALTTPSTPSMLSAPPLQLKKVTSSELGEPLSTRIKNAITVYDLVTQYANINLDAQGRGLCPFHEDEHTSFGVNITGNYWHCWAGCGGGSVIDFWMKWRELHGQSGDFKETIKDLVQRLF